MGRCRATLGTIACAAATLACATMLACGATALDAPVAQAARTVHPRMGAALGIVPAHGAQLEVATGTNFPVVYHGGSVMHGVTVHTIFWAPPGHSFDGSPGAGIAGYVQLIQQFFSDTARDSGGGQNVFSVLGEYPDGSGPAGYRVAYSPAADSVYDTQPYPPGGRQCASPGGVATCVTDLQVQQEIDRVSGSSPAGLGDVWFVFLPPDVDECTSSGNCGSSVFAGYHSFGDVGHGERVYVVVPDPLIEFTPGPGSDPQGNPEAETAIVTAAHELVESITDPEGTGWMDPNGFEAADKCEVGPQPGTPLGYGANGSPYNQVIGGDIYLLQTIWSNAASGCLLRSSSTLTRPGLPSVSLSQFSPAIRGNIGNPTRGIDVFVALERAKRVVAWAFATTRADGSWGPTSLGPHAVGDDRDQLLVLYGRGGPPADVINTGDGGDPFNESGYTGWLALDHGYRVRKSSIEVAPCGQVGVLGLTVGRTDLSALAGCQTESNLTSVPTGALGSGTRLAMTSEDNRAISTRGLNGALVSLTVPLGEPGAVSAVGNDQLMFLKPSGFPSCTAELEAQLVSCQGLVRGGGYRLTRRRGNLVVRVRATRYGRVRSPRFSVRGGDVITLRNRAGRILTVLHVARLRVSVMGRQTVIASGRCEPGDYFGPAPSSPPVSDNGVGEGGLENTGRICPLNGSARGLPATNIEQTDDFSGGQTTTRVPQLVGFSPSPGATLYGSFVALAQVGGPGAHGSTVGVPGATVSVTITPRGSGRPSFSAANVATAQGRPVASLKPGVYTARWVVRDAVGDTRTVTSVFIEQ